MKKTITVLILLVSTITFAQNQYTKGMQKAFQLWGEGKITEASNMFERISKAENDNWLPYYYVASVNTTASFGETDVKKLTQQLEKAQEFIDVANTISPNNPEVLVQQALIYTAWIAFDGGTYGMTLGPKVTTIYAKVLKVAPDNPRVVFSKAEWDIGSATYFGQDTAPYCKDIERSLELFVNFKPESEFHPNWGQDRAERVLKNCKI